MTRAEWCVLVFRERLVEREDCFALQKGDGAYTLVKSPLTDTAILSHLRGEQTLGLFPYPNGTTKWLCIDIDILQSAAVESVHEKLSEFSIPYLTEFSGRKGFHVWVFFDRAYPNSTARALGRVITTNHEVFPKQENIHEGSYGNLIKAPLGKHQVTGKWCLFVDEELSQLESPYSVLASVDRVNPLGILEICNSGSRLGEDPFPILHHTEVTLSKKDYRKQSLLKDCVSHELHTGTVQGHRNATAHVLATELCWIGVPEGSAYRLLWEVWNPRNSPPLKPSEIQTVIRSVYGKPLFDYGCHPQGTLRNHLQCLGSTHCVYHSVPRQPIQPTGRIQEPLRGSRSESCEDQEQSVGEGTDYVF